MCVHVCVQSNCSTSAMSPDVCMHVYTRDVDKPPHKIGHMIQSCMCNSETQTGQNTQPVHNHTRSLQTPAQVAHAPKRARIPYTCMAKPIEHAYIPRLQLTRKQLSLLTAPGSMGRTLTNLYSQRTQHLESLTWLCSLLCTLP